MQRYRQKTSKCPPQWGFSPTCDTHKIFFKNRALSLLYPYGALTSCKKLEKTNEQSLRYSKTDGLTDQRTDRGDYIGPPRIHRGPKLLYFYVHEIRFWTSVHPRGSLVIALFRPSVRPSVVHPSLNISETVH